MIKKYIFLCVMLSLLLSQFSCGNKTEGCTDANATNFNVGADKNCCCEFPKLGIEFLFTYDDKVLTPRDTLKDANGDLFLIDRISFYVSDIVFTDQNQDSLRYDPRVWIFPRVLNGRDSISAIDDYHIIDSERNTTSLGHTFTTPLYIKQLSFLVGVKDSAQTGIPERIRPLNHPLNISLDSLYNFQGMHYDVLRLEVRKLTPDTAYNQVYRIQNLDARTWFHFAIEDNLHLGFDAAIRLRFNVQRFLQNVRFYTDDETQIIETLSSNLPASISG